MLLAKKAGAIDEIVAALRAHVGDAAVSQNACVTIKIICIDGALACVSVCSVCSVCSVNACLLRA